ncbi:hypothetical protein G3T14_21265 [Methylobacterium sp. BTF04]|uniref:hypothetical protein n=1 Tax=Methylobacterium sp. BTF04 TaxID=2708300 RepID=UPI0013CF4DF6|nr:hypothetical protein [Methylobacterium sp. BTF04]NEU14618.1 hypothetical protein [Methylobacterium sp. BTF04]
MSKMETHDLHSGPLNPANPHPASFEAWQAIVAPGDVFRHPRDVLAHPGLTDGEKRTILASWVSDAHALENAPGLRCLSGSRAEPVSVDALLVALAELDRGISEKAAAQTHRAPRRRRRRLANLGWHIRRGRRDDDDDPPPCPATILPRPRAPSGAGATAVPA